MEEKGVSVNLDKLKVLSETLKLKIEALEIASKNILGGILTIDLFFYQALMSIFYLLMFLPINNRLSIIK